ncbi:helix-turn-helix transcriptional regulator [Actinoallomurus sp. NPDC052274]|uniref:helix-turn-helix transcriptional regulator n=1 Tax=Actinoallomurus sp. NPDC052274 TaxID=3155420 RepID=UPI00341B0FD9
MDLPADFTTGERIRHSREKRGMTRAVVANLVGYSSDWLKRIEAGQRGISIPALVRLARVLKVDDLSDLIDGATPMPVSAWEGPAHPAADAVREIVDAMTFRPMAADAPPPDVTALTARLRRAWRDWHALPDNHSVVASVLPALISDLERATIVLEGTERRRAHAALTSAYGLTQHLAVDLVEPEVGRIIADRAARSAQMADDPVSLAFGAWTHGHVLRSVDADAALWTVREAAAELRRHMEDDEDAVGLYGSLCLHMAISAAYQGQDGEAWRLWDAADRVARNLSSGYSHPQTIFGPSNVDIHGVSLAAELRRFGEAVARAERIVPENVPSRERRGRLYGEIAAGHMQRRQLDDARRYLELAYLESPEEVPFSPLTRGVAVELVRAATGPLKADAVRLAERIGVLSTG